MEWEKLSTNRWRCRYHITIKITKNRLVNCPITCDIYRRGKKKHCTWNVWFQRTGDKIWSGKVRGVQQAKDEIAARILENKLLG